MFSFLNCLTTFISDRINFYFLAQASIFSVYLNCDLHFCSTHLLTSPSRDGLNRLPMEFTLARHQAGQLLSSSQHIRTEGESKKCLMCDVIDVDWYWCGIEYEVVEWEDSIPKCHITSQYGIEASSYIDFIVSSLPFILIIIFLPHFLSVIMLIIIGAGLGNQGVAIVSEFISSARVMRGALIVNPWKVDEVSWVELSWAKLIRRKVLDLIVWVKEISLCCVHSSYCIT